MEIKSHKVLAHDEWRLYTNLGNFWVEFKIEEQVISEGYQIYHPIDKAVNEPSTIVLYVEVLDVEQEDKEGNWYDKSPDLTEDTREIIEKYIVTNIE